MIDFDGFEIDAYRAEFVGACTHCDLLLYRLYHDDGTMLIHASLDDDGTYYASVWPCDGAFERILEAEMRRPESMRAGGMPSGYEPPTAREQIADAADPDQVVSFGPSGIVFTPSARGLVYCPECTDTYISRAAYDAHLCAIQAREQESEESDAESG